MNNKLKIDKLLKEIQKVMSQFNKVCIKCETYFKGNGHYCKMCKRNLLLETILK